MCGQSSSSPAVTEFVAQINSEVVRVFRNASHPQDVDAEAVTAETKWSLASVLRWLVERYQEVRDGAARRDDVNTEQELLLLMSSNELERALGRRGKTPLSRAFAGSKG